ncbi:MAG: hypothetical protein U0359_33500 [Byssovorax sp.]
MALPLSTVRSVPTQRIGWGEDQHAVLIVNERRFIARGRVAGLSGHLAHHQGRANWRP